MPTRTLANDIRTIINMITGRTAGKHRRTAAVNRRKLAILTATAITAGTLITAPFIANAAADTAAAEAATAALSQQGSLNHDQLAIYPVTAKFKAGLVAQATIDNANVVIAAATSKVDASTLQTHVANLARYELLGVDRIEILVNETKTAAQQTADAVAAHDAEVARQKAAAEAAAAAAAAEALRVANTPDGARAQARDLMSSQFGWGDGQFQCLDQLWMKESGWRVDAYNAGSGATGIVQALPGSKMASAGPDWQTSARTQILWGLGYIADRYGSPCSAWSHSQSMNWY